MTGHDHPSPAQTTLQSEPEVTFTNSISSLGTRFANWVATAADYYTAAATYLHLCGLSDAELQLRGLSRATLASDICQACDRTARPSQTERPVRGQRPRAPRCITQSAVRRFASP